MNLTYRADLAHGHIDGLGLNECTVHRCRDDAGAWWWILWFNVARATDGVPEIFEVPVSPGGSFSEGCPAGKTWGFTQIAAGTWQVAPSINVLDTGEKHPGPHPTAGSLWHETPTIVRVPAGEAWIPR